MNRRRLLIAFAIAAAAPRVRAQQAAKTPRVGLLCPYSAPAAAAWFAAFREGLKAHGWTEGRNIALEYRYADGRQDRLPELANDLVRLNVNVIVTSVTSDAIAAAKATRTIPIVMASIGDPVGSGLVATLARPGGNVTGLSQVAPEAGGKRLELMREIIPKLTRAAVMWNPLGAGSSLNWKEIQAPAQRLGIHVQPLEVRRAEDIEKAFDEVAKTRPPALIVLPDALFVTHLKRIAELASRTRTPSIFHLGEYAEAGGLLTYGADRDELFRRAATFVDKILRGAKPSDLPVEQANKFELVINLKTAKALGLTIPQSLLLRADKVIE